MSTLLAGCGVIVGVMGLILFLMYYIGAGQRRYLIVAIGWALIAIAAAWVISAQT